MEEVLEMGTKPKQRDAPSPQLPSAKPLEEIEPFFFEPLFSEFACTILVQLITVQST